MVKVSSFIVGMRADITYGRLPIKIRQNNKGCFSCNATFALDSKVHKLACGHIFHADCGNQIFSEAAESKYSKKLVGVRMACADPCAQEIQFNEENMRRGLEFKEKLLKMTPEELNQYMNNIGEEEAKFINEFCKIFIAGAIKLNKSRNEKIKAQNQNITRIFAFIGVLTALVFGQFCINRHA